MGEEKLQICFKLPKGANKRVFPTQSLENLLPRLKTGEYRGALDRNPAIRRRTCQTNR